MDTEQIFIERVRRLRSAKGISQQKAADALGITKTGYQNYEYGRKMPSFSVLPRIADFFNVSIDYLLGRTDVPQVVRSAQWQANGGASG